MYPLPMANTEKTEEAWLGVLSAPDDTPDTDPGALAARQLVENAGGSFRYSRAKEKTLYCVVGDRDEAEKVFRKERKVAASDNVTLVSTTLPTLNLLDLTLDATLKQMKIFRSQLTSDDYTTTQMISTIARRSRYNGILAPVADSTAKLLVLFY